MIETRAGDVATREAFKLAELFQKLVEDHKARAPLLDQLVKTSGKFLNQMNNFQTGFNDLLTVFQKIADCASATSGSSTDIGTCLSRIVLRHRQVEDKLEALNQDLCEGLVFIQSKTADCKTCVSKLDKDHGKVLKKMRSVVKKRSGSLVKLEKKVKKEYSQKKECELAELLLVCKEFEAQERNAVQTLAAHERNFFSSFLEGMKPVFLVEMAMFKESSKIDETIEDIDKIVGHATPSFDTSDGIISLVRETQGEESASSHFESLFEPRIGSLQSLNSFCGSRLSCNVIMDPPSSVQTQSFVPRMIDRSSSLSNDSKDSGIVSRPLTSDMQTTFVPIDTIQNWRYSTVRRTPSPIRSSRISLAGSPSSRGRLSSKPPLPRRLPIPARSPSIENPTDENTSQAISIIGRPNNEDILNILTHLDILDSPTEEDQEVLYYMTGDQSDSISLDAPSRCSEWSGDEESYKPDELPPPPDFLLYEY